MRRIRWQMLRLSSGEFAQGRPAWRFPGSLRRSTLAGRRGAPKDEGAKTPKSAKSAHAHAHAAYPVANASAVQRRVRAGAPGMAVPGRSPAEHSRGAPRDTTRPPDVERRRLSPGYARGAFSRRMMARISSVAAAPMAKAVDPPRATRRSVFIVCSLPSKSRNRPLSPVGDSCSSWRSQL